MKPPPLPLDVSPPEFLRLAGHPLRWKLLHELARSDLSVQELTARAGEPQNLVSYHLGKLRDGALVSARRSSADRRDTYYGLNLARVGALLSETGGALHPGLRLVAPAPLEEIAPARVLFLCTGNSARSPMAQALTQARSGGAIAAFSAGSEPKPVHPNAERVMREDYGLDLSQHTPRHLEVFAEQPFEWVISLCDRVREACPDNFANAAPRAHWSIPNPATGARDDETYALFKETAAALSARIDFLLAKLAEKTPAAEQ